MRLWPFWPRPEPLEAPKKSGGRKLRKLKARVGDLEDEIKRLRLDGADLWERVERAVGRITGRERGKNAAPAEPPALVDINEVIREGGSRDAILRARTGKT